MQAASSDCFNQQFTNFSGRKFGAGKIPRLSEINSNPRGKDSLNYSPLHPATRANSHQKAFPLFSQLS